MGQGSGVQGSGIRLCPWPLGGLLIKCFVRDEGMKGLAQLGQDKTSRLHHSSQPGWLDV